MPTIQSRKKANNQYLVTIAFPDGRVEEAKVSEDLIVEYRVSEGKSFDDSAFASFQKAMRLDAAYQIALRALKRRPQSAKEVREGLEKSGLTETEVKTLMAKLRRLNLVDDGAFAVHFIDYESEVKRSGPKKIMFELQRRGIAPDLIDDALRSIDPARWDRQLTRLWNKYEPSWKKKPYAAAVMAMKAKFFELGYPEDAVKRLQDQVLPGFRESGDDASLLKAAYEKAVRQLKADALDPKKFKQKLIERLLRKGFRFEAIMTQIAGGSSDESEDFGF
jgi:regulatory protein